MHIIIIAIIVLIFTGAISYKILKNQKENDTLKGDYITPAEINNVSADSTTDIEEAPVEDYDGNAYYYSELQRLIVELAELTS